MSTFRERFDHLRNAQKRPTGVPLYTLLVNRPIGRVIAAASPAWITPNALTVVSAALSYASLLVLLVLAEPTPWAALIGVGLIVAFFFDSADGQLARLRRGGSASGEWLDHVFDGGKIVLMHVATLAYLLRAQAIPMPLAFAGCTVYIVAASVTFFAGGLFEKLTVTAPTAARSRRSWFRSVLLLALDSGIANWLYLLLPFAFLFSIVYLLFAAASAVGGGALLVRWFRLLRREDAARHASRESA